MMTRRPPDGDIEYPGLPVDYVLEMVHRFYDEYYFRPRRLPRRLEGIVNRDLPRLYVEAKPSSSCVRSATRW